MLNQCPEKGSSAALPQVKTNALSYCSVSEKAEPHSRRLWVAEPTHLWAVRSYLLLWPMLGSLSLCSEGCHQGLPGKVGCCSDPASRAAPWHHPQAVGERECEGHAPVGLLVKVRLFFPSVFTSDNSNSFQARLSGKQRVFFCIWSQMGIQRHFRENWQDLLLLSLTPVIINWSHGSSRTASRL